MKLLCVWPIPATVELFHALDLIFNCRGSRPEVFCRKDVSPNSQESNCTRVYFLIKLQAWGEFGEISKNTFFYRTPPVTVSVVKVSKSFERGWGIYDLWVHCFYEQSRECYHRHNRKFHICLQIKINVLCGYVIVNFISVCK